MLRQSLDELRQVKTELVRLVIMGPISNCSAASTAAQLIGELAGGSAAGSRIFRVAAGLREQFEAWFGYEQPQDAAAKNERRAKMLLAIGELADLASRR